MSSSSPRAGEVCTATRGWAKVPSVPPQLPASECSHAILQPAPAAPGTKRPTPALSPVMPPHPAAAAPSACCRMHGSGCVCCAPRTARPRPMTLLPWWSVRRSWGPSACSYATQVRTPLACTQELWVVSLLPSRKYGTADPHERSGALLLELTLSLLHTRPLLQVLGACVPRWRPMFPPAIFSWCWQMTQTCPGSTRQSAGQPRRLCRRQRVPSERPVAAGAAAAASAVTAALSATRVLLAMSAQHTLCSPAATAAELAIQTQLFRQASSSTSFTARRQSQPHLPISLVV